MSWKECSIYPGEVCEREGDSVHCHWGPNLLIGHRSSPSQVLEIGQLFMRAGTMSNRFESSIEDLAHSAEQN